MIADAGLSVLGDIPTAHLVFARAIPIEYTASSNPQTAGRYAIQSMLVLAQVAEDG
jgi:hypothetical protein